MNNRPGLGNRLLQGAAGGLAATLTMSAGLGAADVLGVMNRQPPKKIVQRFLPGLGKDTTDATATAAHVGYDVAAGAVYGALLKPESRNTVNGIAYGLLIWAISYEGWLPAFGILPPAQRDKPGRAVTMFAAHILYGATLGAAGGRFARR
jgi:uncharacterized protein DUF6789